MDKIAPHLLRHYSIQSNRQISKNLADQLNIQFHRGYTTPLSTRDVLRTQNDFRIMNAIRRKLKRNKLILRLTDKSNILYIGRSIDFDKKAQAYREKTKAYQELTSNPLEEILYKVTHLLNDLHAQKLVQVKQYGEMMPKRDKVRLGYMYFNPKVHKVRIKNFSSTELCVIIIERCTTSTNYIFNSSTNHTYFEILRSITSTNI